MDRLTDDRTQIVLSCGHTIITGDVVKPKKQLPVKVGTVRHCYKCQAGVKPDVKLPKKRKPKGTSNHEGRSSR